MCQRSFAEIRRRATGSLHCFALALLVLSAPAAEAGAIYKSVGPDGHTVYSDTPPASGRTAREIKSETLPASPVPDEILRFREQMLKNADSNAKAEKAAGAAGVTLFSAAWCGYCRQAKAYLAEKGIAYREQDIDTESGKQALAIAGGSSIPLLIRNGKRLTGFQRSAYDALFR